jgi:peptidyl-prolyl cis-trans isomerase D
MKQGDIAPVQGAIGMAVVEIQKVTPGKVATLQEVRPRIEAEVRKDAATEKVYDLVQKYEDARSGGATMAEASKKLGLTPQPIPVPLTAQGTTLNNQQSGLPPDLLKTAFSLPQGGESDVQSAGEGEYYAIRVDRINAPAVVSLEEARGPITQLFTFEELRKRMQAKADELAARVRKGEPLAAVAQSAGAAVSHSPELRRDFAGPITANTVAAIFNAKTGETIVAADDQAGVVVAKVLGVVPGPPLELARAAETQRQALRQSLFSDMGFAARNAARDAVKPRLDYARARTALGLEPEPAAQTKGAPPAPASKK